jgi:hypothetical protein
MMSSFVVADAVWETIGDLASKGGEKKAAVSYVTSDVVVKFRKGDLLVVDATDDAVRAGQTSAPVLRRAVMRGAQVVSVPRLHAKVMVFDRVALIGSANISVHSASQLIEALFVAKEQGLVNSISRWIEGLARTGKSIDEITLAHLLAISPKRERALSTFRMLVEPHIVFYKQVLEGDIQKYNTRSSTAGTGGGARDLRVSPVKRFQPLLQTMLSEPGSTPGVTRGRVLSYRRGKEPVETTVELWPPTSARSNELRISCFYEVPGWAVNHDELQRAEQAGQMLFYVLEMDVHGTTVAKVLSDEQLARDSRAIGEHMKKQSLSTARKAIVGAVDVLRQVAVP